MDKKARITNTKTMPELATVVGEFDIIKGGHKEYTGSHLKELVVHVDDGTLPPNFLTRAEGLRKQAMKLMGYSKDQIDYLCAEDKK